MSTRLNATMEIFSTTHLNKTSRHFKISIAKKTLNNSFNKARCQMGLMRKRFLLKAKCCFSLYLIKNGLTLRNLRLELSLKFKTLSTKTKLLKFY